MGGRKYTYWLLTVPFDKMPVVPKPKDGIVYIKGQQEIGESGYHHWQLLVSCDKQRSMSYVKKHFVKEAHVEHSLSEAADAYVWKDESSVPGTRFEWGTKPKKLNTQTDWDEVYDLAKNGQFNEIPRNIYIRHRHNLRAIYVENMDPDWRHDINVRCYWGDAGLGKTRRAFHEAGNCFYLKAPNTKWWDSYRGQTEVIIDEFTGSIAINHLQNWFDRYPCAVEIKGGQIALRAINIWITSNLHPRDWYPDAKPYQVNGLLRRMKVEQIVFPWIPPTPPPPIVVVPPEDPVDPAMSTEEEDNYVDTLLNLVALADEPPNP